MLLSCVLTALTGCATTEASTSTTTATTPADAGKRLVDAAEAALHCAGEEATDDARGAFLAECYETNKKLARDLLPKVPAASLPAGVHAAVELFVVDDLDEDQLGALCRELPAADFMPGLLDDEARASHCATAN
jgi:hypothetical protein